MDKKNNELTENYLKITIFNGTMMRSNPAQVGVSNISFIIAN
jgi:hypothetical protein